MPFHHQEEKQINLYAEKKTLHLDKKKNSYEGWIQSNVRFGPVSDKKVCDKYGRHSVEV